MQTEAFKIRNIEFGKGLPKICVPVVGRTEEEILTKTKEIVKSYPDCIEFRGDWFEAVMDSDVLRDLLEQMREVIGEIPLLFTYRSAKEGGEHVISIADYENLCKFVCDSGLVDLLDVEAYMKEGLLRTLCGYAHEKGVKVVASNHDFSKTPDTDEMTKRLQYMDLEGADLPKIAVMPQTERDVLNLMSASLAYYEAGGVKPIITMSMKQLGVISRVVGNLTGSALTFATVGDASAPGQLPIEVVRNFFAVMHE